MGCNEDIIYDEITELVSRLGKKIEELQQMIPDLENIQFRICEVKGYKITPDDKGLMQKAKKVTQ